MAPKASSEQQVHGSRGPRAQLNDFPQRGAGATPAHTSRRRSLATFAGLTGILQRHRFKNDDFHRFCSYPPLPGAVSEMQTSLHC